MGLLNSFMRAFSIRLRMVGAIAVVLCLLLMVGGTGLWGMGRMQAYNHAFVSHSLSESAALSRLEVGLGSLRRHERDLLIQHDQPDQLRTAKAAWEQALQTVRASMQDMLAGEADEDNRVIEEVAQQLEAYQQAVLPVFAQLEQGGYESPSAADQALGAAHASFDAIDGLMQRVQAILSAEVKDTQAASERESKWVWALFTAVLLVAAIVVAPSTLANMHSITRPLQQAQGLAVSIARGDLTTKPDVRGKDELAELMRCLVDMQTSLSRTVHQVRQTADQINVASHQIADENSDLSQRTEQTASNLQSAASSMEQITAAVRQSAEAARSASSMAQDNATVAQRGGELVKQVVLTMDEINQSSQKIHDIIGVIDGIAFQTNILALNAAVEAARAGEAGRGFAVVAGEVRSLAQRSAEAAREIKGLISNSVERIDVGTQIVHQAGGAIQDIVNNAQKVSSFIAEITTASAEQSQGLAEVNVTVSELDQMTQQNAGLVEHSAVQADNLRAQAQSLSDLVAIFKMLGDGESGHLPLVPAATRGHGGENAYAGRERRQRPRA
ncbi:MAG TPA: methyl-accepting chemotaxis protein [Macromonas sp.]|nr:methyl-accepting chemotaxis protein [Macromonas sp.]